MHFEYFWLALATLTRLFYLAAIFTVLWFQGFFWSIVAISALFLIANVFFAAPLALDLARLSRVITGATYDDNDDENNVENELNESATTQNKSSSPTKKNP